MLFSRVGEEGRGKGGRRREKGKGERGAESLMHPCGIDTEQFYVVVHHKACGGGGGKEGREERRPLHLKKYLKILF